MGAPIFRSYVPLTHLAALYFAFERLASYPLALRFAVFVGLAVALPVGFYHAIEEPFVRLGKRITRKRPVVPRFQFDAGIVSGTFPAIFSVWLGHPAAALATLPKTN